MGTAADLHMISGADLQTARESGPDSHVTQSDATGDKPICGETTAIPPTSQADTAAHTDIEVTGEANTSTRAPGYPPDQKMLHPRESKLNSPNLGRW